jgi:hypothetical protein
MNFTDRTKRIKVPLPHVDADTTSKPHMLLLPVNLQT